MCIRDRRACHCACGPPLRALGWWTYSDGEFIGAAALGAQKGKSAADVEAETDWVRAADVVLAGGGADAKKRPQLFAGEIEPEDLCQGAVGDCWLVAALASASEYRQVIQRAFLVPEYNPRGRYPVRLFDPQARRWVVVVVDDRLPCYKGTRLSLIHI